MSPNKDRKIGEDMIEAAAGFGFHQLNDEGTFGDEHGRTVDLSSSASDRGSVAINILTQLLK